MLGAMNDTQSIAGFAPGEREYIRRELDQFFSTLPTVAEGFPLRVWRGGQHAGEPKIPPSTLSHSHCRVKPLQLDAGVGAGELPVSLGVMLVPAVLPSGDFVDQGLLVGDAAIETLP